MTRERPSYEYFKCGKTAWRSGLCPGPHRELVNSAAPEPSASAGKDGAGCHLHKNLTPLSVSALQASNLVAFGH